MSKIEACNSLREFPDHKGQERVNSQEAAIYLVPQQTRKAKREAKRESDDGIVRRAIAIVGRRLSERSVFATPDAVKTYCAFHLAKLDYEVFGVLFLDVQNRLIEYESMFRGTLTQTSVYPREVVLAALTHKAAAVVLTHNHPSGTVQPSRADEALTQTLKTALALIDVRVLDHVIVAPGEAMSMAERGLL